MILPVGAANFKEAMKMGCEVYHHLKVRQHLLTLNIVLVDQAIIYAFEFRGMIGVFGSIKARNLI